jgi:glucokinase
MSDIPVVLGLDFGATKIAAAVCDPAGRRLGTVTVASHGDLGAAAAFGAGLRAARGLLAGPASGRRLAAVGVSTFGIPYHDRVELAPGIAGWDRLAIGAEISAAFPGAALRMATDAKAAAAAEARWGALADCDPGVYLNLGTGLSAAIVTGGVVLAGANGAAGEIGYNLRAPSDLTAGLGARMPLEDMVSGQALAARAGAHTSHGRSATAAQVFAASAGDPELDGLVTSFLTELAFHVVNLAICLNPERIAVGGGLVRSWDRIWPDLQQALQANVPYPPELVAARYRYAAPLIGAVALAVSAACDAEPANGSQPSGLAAADWALTDADRAPAGDDTLLSSPQQDIAHPVTGHAGHH